MSKNIVFEGWLTKSPPTKRIWRAKWRRRWFALRQSEELPGQYFLDYYADRNCRRLKGTINLDLCEQVDAGLHMERSGSSPLAPRFRGSVFSVRTQSRTYHLEADCEDDMEKWVHAICQVCNLRATEDVSNDGDAAITISPPINAISLDADEMSGGGPYIPISECITGVRNQEEELETFDKAPESSHLITQQPRPNPELSENESNFSDEECKSLNAAQPVVLGDWTVARSFTKLKISPTQNGIVHPGPPVPPRPPKTFAMSRDLLPRDTVVPVPKVHEPVTSNIQIRPSSPWRTGGRRCYSRVQTSPARRLTRCMEDDDLVAIQHTYLNLLSLPPAVDRALKPRHSSVGHIHTLISNDRIKPDVLQYLDLDLHTSKPESKATRDLSTERVKIHGKSLSSADPACEYHTVDFIKTEAFNIMRLDAEASRSFQNSTLNY